MRLKNYLDESWQGKEVITVLERDCKQFIKEISKSDRLLLRGSKKPVKDILKIKSRTDRYPKDMPIDLHKDLDNLFKKKFGWKARTEGTFATSCFTTANKYGMPYLFFPIGEYKFIWSTFVFDLYFLKSDLYGGNIEKIIDTYKNTNLIQAIKSEHEIMFKCKEHYLVDIKYRERILGK